MEVIKTSKEKRFIYLYKSGTEDNACKMNGWALLVVCYDERKFHHSVRISIITALNNAK